MQKAGERMSELIEKIHHRMVTISEAELRRDWGTVAKCRYEILNLINEWRDNESKKEGTPSTTP